MEGRKLNSREKWMIVDLKQSNMPDKLIIEHFELKFGYTISRSTITKIIQRFDERGTVDRPEVSGRPRKFNSKEEEQLLKLVKEKPFLSMEQLCEDEQANPKGSCNRTIRRVLQSNQIRAYSINKNRINCITEDNIDKRINFALSVVNWSIDDWSKVYFSDECDIYGELTQPLTVRRRPNDHVDLPTTIFMKSKKVKVWGLISFSGVIELIPYEGTLDGHKYAAIPEEVFRHKLKEFKRKESLFMQDNATPHNSSVVINKIDDLGITLLDWPPQSPDLNPIENIWSVVKQRLWELRDEVYTTEDALRIIKGIWYSIPRTYIRSLYQSLPGRIEKLFHLNGQRIN